MTPIKYLTSHPNTKEESAFKESCISNVEQLFEQEIEEDKEEVLGEMNLNENHAYESFIEQWFQASSRLVQSFSFYFAAKFAHSCIF